MVTTAVISLIVVTVLGVIGKALLNYFVNSAYTWEHLFYNSFIVEINFLDLTYSISIKNLYKAIYGFAIALLIMFFVKKMIETYISWTNGDPEQNPLSILIGFIKAAIIMICFGFIYEQFVAVLYDMLRSFISALTLSDSIETFKMLTQKNYFVDSPVDGIFIIVFCIFYFSIIFQTITRGLEILILRLGIPFACIGLINSDGGAFNGYIKKFISNGFTVIVQILLVQISLAFLAKNHFVLATSSMLMASRTPQMLHEFMITAGTGFMSKARSVSSTIHSVGIMRAISTRKV